MIRGSHPDVIRRLTVVEGDITGQDVDAIVTAANEGLRGGGGVDGAVHRAAGRGLLMACSEIGHCPTGSAVITPGFSLKARHVIHAVGPVWRGGDSNEKELLASAYRRSVELAAEAGLRTIAFPAISTGVYAYPPDLAAPVAVNTVAETIAGLPIIAEARFVCFSAESARLHRDAIATLADR